MKEFPHPLSLAKLVTKIDWKAKKDVDVEYPNEQLRVQDKV